MIKVGGWEGEGGTGEVVVSLELLSCSEGDVLRWETFSAFGGVRV